MMNVFEKATKEKIRFEYKGLISVEDLWDLDVVELDGIYKKLNSEKKQISEESLLDVPTIQNTLLNTKLKLVKYIVEFKLAETESRKQLAEKKAKKETIMAILANKQNTDLENKTTEELQEMLNSL